MPQVLFLIHPVSYLSVMAATAFSNSGCDVFGNKNFIHAFERLTPAGGMLSTKPLDPDIHEGNFDVIIADPIFTDFEKYAARIEADGFLIDGSVARSSPDIMDVLLSIICVVYARDYDPDEIISKHDLFDKSPISALVDDLRTSFYNQSLHRRSAVTHELSHAEKVDSSLKAVFEKPVVEYFDRRGHSGAFSVFAERSANPPMPPL